MSLPVKYRPTTFDDVVGQDQVVTSLKKVVADKRGKAFIFAGPSGTGKTTLARIVANAFAGEGASSANIIEIAAADHTGVDAMREITQRALTRAIGGSPVKAIILDEAHRLSSQAWDVLLKPIEEPPNHVYWFLSTTIPEKIPRTIQTRCLRFELRSVAEDTLLELLCKVADAEGMATPDDVLEVISEGSGGSPRQALTFLEACAACNNRSEAQALIRAGTGSKEAVDLCRFIVKGRGAWPDAMRLVKAIEADAESIRIVVVNYLSVVLGNAKSNDEALRLLQLLDAFEKPYNVSDKLGPLMLSLGIAMGLGR